MTVSLKHDFQSALADSADTSLVRPSNWNAEHVLTMGAAGLLGADTAGAVEEITVGSGLLLSGNTLSASGGAAATGWTMVDKNTVSGVSTLDFALDTTTYSEFYIHFVGTLTSLGSLRARVSQSGSFLSGAADYAFSFDEIVFGDVTDQTSDFIQVSANADANMLAATRCHLLNPGSTTLPKLVRFDGSMVQAGPLLSLVQGGGMFYGNNSAIDGFRLYPSFGGQMSGSYKLLGIPV